MVRSTCWFATSRRPVRRIAPFAPQPVTKAQTHATMLAALARLQEQPERGRALEVRAALRASIGARDDERARISCDAARALGDSNGRCCARKALPSCAIAISRTLFASSGSHLVGMIGPCVLRDAIARSMIGQREVVEGLLLSLIAGGHILIEGPPGLAKTLACRVMAQAIDGSFGRIQFTADLLPSDVIGTRVFDQRTAEFRTVAGPIFANASGKGPNGAFGIHARAPGHQRRRNAGASRPISRDGDDESLGLRRERMHSRLRRWIAFY